MSIRDRILNSKDITSEIVVIPEWDDVKIEVREKTVSEQYALLEKCRYKSGPKEGEINGELLAIETILATCYDPDTGEKVFDSADRDMLKQKSSAAFQRLLVAANRAAGLDEESEVVSGLDETPTAESSSE